MQAWAEIIGPNILLAQQLCGSSALCLLGCASLMNCQLRLDTCSNIMDLYVVDCATESFVFVAHRRGYDGLVCSSAATFG